MRIVSSAGLFNKQKQKRGFIYFIFNGSVCESEYSALNDSTII